jgi:hypothetical protein
MDDRVEGKDDTIGIKGPPYRQLGVDAKWEHCIVVADANGNIVETWTQWDKLLRRPHSVYQPHDPEKHVWIVDDNMQVIYKFTHDGKQLVQTIGTPEQEARTRRTSTGRRSWTGCPTGPSSCPTVHGHASRSSTRTGSS